MPTAQPAAPSQTYVNANGDTLPPPPPVDQPGLLSSRGGHEPDLGFLMLPLGTRLLKSKVVVVALAPPRSARTMTSLSERHSVGVARVRDVDVFVAVWARISAALCFSGSNDAGVGATQKRKRRVSVREGQRGLGRTRRAWGRAGAEGAAFGLRVVSTSQRQMWGKSPCYRQAAACREPSCMPCARRSRPRLGTLCC